LKLADTMKLLAGSLKGFAIAAVASGSNTPRSKEGSIGMAPTPEKVGAETWIRVSGTVKRGSGLSTANYRRA